MRATWVVVAWLHGSSALLGAEPLPPKYKVGEQVPILYEYRVTGPTQGLSSALAFKFFYHPFVAIYCRELDEQVLRLLKKLDEATAKHSTARDGKSLGSYLVLLSDDTSRAKELAAVAEKEKIGHTILSLGVLKEGKHAESWRAFDTDLGKATTMVLLAKPRATIKAAFAYRKGELSDKEMDRILADLTALLQADAKSQPTGMVGALSGHAGPVFSLAFTRDGKTLASADGPEDLPGEVKLWDLTTAKERTALRGHRLAAKVVAFSPDDKTLATAGGDGKVLLWEVSTGKELASLSAHEGRATCVAFTPDGRTLASAGEDGIIRLWDTTTRKERASLRGHTKSVQCLAFSKDGQLLASGGNDATIKLWRVNEAKERVALKGHTNDVRCLAFSPDGATLASGNSARELKLWDVIRGKERAVLNGHVSRVVALAFTPNGRTLITGSHDATVRLWASHSGAQLDEIKHPHWVASLALTEDGKTLATGMAMGFKENGKTLAVHSGEIRLWDMAALQQHRHAAILGTWNTIDRHLALGSLYQPVHGVRKREGVVHFHQDGDRLKGWAIHDDHKAITRQERWKDGRTDFRKVSFEGDKLTFEWDIGEWFKSAGPLAVEQGRLANKGTVRVVATLKGDRLTGQWGMFLVDGSEPFRGEWEAVRVQEPGPLLLVGGTHQDLPADIRDLFFQLAGDEKAKVVVIPTAVATPEGKKPDEYLKPPGVTPLSFQVLHTRDRKMADDPAFVKPLTEATAVFITNGHRHRLFDAYRGTLVEKELKRLHARGGLIAGTGRGAFVLGELLSTRGGADALTEPGFGLLPGFLLDEGEGRLAEAVAAKPAYVGLTFEDGTAALIQGKDMRILGKGTATLRLAKGADQEAKTDTLKVGTKLDLDELRRAAEKRAKQQQKK